MNFSEQQTLLSELLGDPNTDSDDMFPSARRLAALNRGDIQFCEDSLCVKEYATGTVASSKIDCPSGWVKNHCLIINDEVIDDWRQIDLHQWERYVQNNSEEPFYYLWTFSGTKSMRFLSNANVNGKTYYLYYFKKQTSALALDADESIIPDQYREAPVFYAAYWLFLQIGQYQRAAAMKNVYDDFVAKADAASRREFLQENRPSPDTGDQRLFGGYRQGDGGYR